jgi:RNA polymerase sigma-70 factor (ECF subfamily)
MGDQREIPMAAASGSAFPAEERPAAVASTVPTTAEAVWLHDRKALVRLAHRFVWSPDDAEDIVQEAILHAQRSREQLRDPDKAWAWLRRIVVRQSLLHLRRAKQRRRDFQSPGLQQTTSPEQKAVEREQVMMLRSAIEELPPRQQTAVTLRHLEEMSYAEIAKIMDITEATVRFHVRQGRLALAARLEGGR